jgi:hypothetical protein
MRDLASAFSSVLRHVNYFQNLVVVNSAIIDMGVQVALLYPGLHSLEYMPRSGIAESYGWSMFSFFEDPPYCFPICNCTNLHSHQQ